MATKATARFYSNSVAFYFLPALAYYKINTLTYQEDQNKYPRVGRKTKIYRLDFNFLTVHAQFDFAVIGEAKKPKEEKVEVEEQVREYRAKRKVKRNWPPRNFWKRGQV